MGKRWVLYSSARNEYAIERNERHPEEGGPNTLQYQLKKGSFCAGKCGVSFNYG